MNFKIVDDLVEHPVMTILGLNNEEILRFEKNGDIFIHNKLIVNDIEVVDGFREFLIQRGLISI